MTAPRDEVAAAIRDTLSTPNESDSNMEPANVADGLYQVARALTAISHGDVRGPAGLEALAMAVAGPGLSGDGGLAAAVRDGLGDVADGLRDVGAALRDTGS